MNWNKIYISAEDYDNIGGFQDRMQYLKSKGYPAFNERYLREMSLTKINDKSAWCFSWIDKDDVAESAI